VDKHVPKGEQTLKELTRKDCQEYKGGEKFVPKEKKERERKKVFGWEIC